MARSNSSGFVFWLPLIASLFAALGFTMDGTMLSVASEIIAGDLSASSEVIVLALTVYSAVLAGLTIAAGKMGDILGKRKMLIIGMIIFIVGSIAAALSTNAIMFLSSWSVFKTIGAVFILPVFVSCFIVSYEGKDRATAFGLFAAVGGISAAVGPLIMGFLSDTVSWRVAFVVTSFFVLVSIILLLRMKEMPKLEGVSIDWVGAILMLISFFTIAFGLGQSNYWYLILVGVVVLGVFVVWAYVLEKQGKSPIFRLSLLGNSQFSVATGDYTLLQLGGTGFGLSFPIIVASLGSFSSVELAILQMPYFLGLFFGSIASGFLGRKLEPKILVVLGFLFGVVGFGSAAWIFASVNSFMQIIPSIIIAGVGYGFVAAWLQNIGLSSLSPKESGEGSGVLKAMSLLGGSIGVALIGALGEYTSAIVVGSFVVGLLLSFALPRLRRKIQ